MAVSPHDTAVGEAALVEWLKETLGFKAMFVPEYAERQGTTVIIQTADATSGDVVAKQHAAADALYKSISAAGYGSQVTPQQCFACAAVVISAVYKARPHST